jgi:hypothetical protein
MLNLMTLPRGLLLHALHQQPGGRQVAPAHVPAWLEIERPNQHAAADDVAARGIPLNAVAIAAAVGEVLIVHSHWDQAASLHRIALAAARHSGDRVHAAETEDLPGSQQGASWPDPAVTPRQGGRRWRTRAGGRGAVLYFVCGVQAGR